MARRHVDIEALTLKDMEELALRLGEAARQIADAVRLVSPTVAPSAGTPQAPSTEMHAIVPAVSSTVENERLPDFAPKESPPPHIQQAKAARLAFLRAQRASPERAELLGQFRHETSPEEEEANG